MNKNILIFLVSIILLTGIVTATGTCQDINTSGIYTLTTPLNFSTQDFQVSTTTVTNNHATVSPTMTNVSDNDPLTYNIPTTGSYYINFTMNNASSTSAILLSRHRVPTQMTAVVYAWNYTSSAWDTLSGDNTLGNSIYLSAYAITITNGFAYTLSTDYFSGGIIQVTYNITAGSAPRWFDSQIYSETYTSNGTRTRTDCFSINANNVLLDFNNQTIIQDSPFNNGNYNLVTIANGLNNVSLTNLEYHSAATGQQIKFEGPITNNSYYTNLHFYGDNIPFNVTGVYTAMIGYNGAVTPSSNVLFENITFQDINDTTTDGSGLYLLFANNIEYLTARNIVVDNVNGGNEMLWFGDLSGSIRNATGVLLENIVFQNMPIHSYLVEHILLGGTQNAIMRNININATGVSGILLNANYNITITNVTNELNVAPPQTLPYEGIRFGTASTINSASTNNLGWWPCNNTLGATYPACYYNSTGQYNKSGTYIDNRTPYYTYEAPPVGIKPNYVYDSYSETGDNLVDKGLMYDDDWNTYGIFQRYEWATAFNIYMVFNDTPNVNVSLIIKPYTESGGALAVYNFSSSTYERLVEINSNDSGTIYNFTIYDNYISPNRDIIIILTGSSYDFLTSGIYDISLYGEYATCVFCTQSCSPCGGGCTATDLSGMYVGYDFVTDAFGVGDITGWNTSCITNMEGMFQNSNFNQNINSWDVSQVYSMSLMFNGDSTFNQPLDSWNTNPVQYMVGMFQGATSFNQPIGNWNVSNVLQTWEMFQDAVNFNQNLSLWNISSLNDATNMFRHSGLSTNNYDSLLLGWSSQVVQPNVHFGGYAQYTPTGLVGRDILTNATNSWTITDGGLASNPSCDGSLSTLPCELSGPYTLSTPDLSVNFTNITGTINEGDIQSGTNWVYVNSSSVANVPATITFNNVSSIAKIPLKNGIKCSVLECSGINYNSGQLRFNVTGFSNYSFGEGPPFISTWNTNLTGGDSPTNATQVLLPLKYTGTYSFRVDWGDNTTSNITAHNQSEVLHNYATIGIYTINITGTIVGFGGFCGAYGGPFDNRKLINITSFGSLSFGTSANGAFQQFSNLESVPSDLDLTGTTNLGCMFQAASKFNGNISGWNTSSVTNMNSMFESASKFNQPIGSWDTSSVTTMQNLFNNAVLFNQSINNWNTSSVIYMTNVFMAASAYNQPLNNWDTHNVIGMPGMFNGASNFNQNLSNWNTGKVTNMAGLFYNADKFNGNISSWNTSSVIEMQNMFGSTESFNQPIGSWDTSKVVYMNSMFEGASVFNQPIGSWDTSKVTTMSRMFTTASAFNQSLNTWDTHSVTTTEMMFVNALSYNQPMNNWNTSNLINANSMFGNTLFNQPLDNWDTHNVTNMGYMFYGATKFNQNISMWNISSVTGSAFSSFDQMFQGVTLSTVNYDALLNGWASQTVNNNLLFSGGNSKYSSVGKVGRDILTGTYNWTITDGIRDTFLTSWDTTKNSTGSSNTTQIQLPLISIGTYNFTINWGDNTTSNITVWNDTNTLHNYATPGNYTINISGTIIGWAFNNVGDKFKIKNIVQWGPLYVGNTGGYFYGCDYMNATATDMPDLSGTTNLSRMFSASDAGSGNYNFNGNISGWDISQVTDLSYFLNANRVFNRSLNSWNTSNVVNMDRALSGLFAYTQPMNNWDTHNVTNMQTLFANSNKFNSNITGWNTSKVTNMADMFNNAYLFNQPIGGWDTSQVTNMADMFMEATIFNQNLSNWNTGKVTSMNYMFKSTAFNQNIGGWNITSVNAMSFGGMLSMFQGSNLSITNYNALLNGWASQPVQSNVIFDAGYSQYTVVGQPGRNILTSTYNWTITDGGFLACIPRWIPATCTLGTNFTKVYTDTNNCEDNSTLPSDNGTIQLCQLPFEYSRIDLSTTDPGNWAGVTSTTRMQYDPINDVIYIISNNAPFWLSVYNHSSNVWTNITKLTTQPSAIYYDPETNLLATGTNVGVLTIFNVSNNYTLYRNTTLIGAGVTSITAHDRIFYVGGSVGAFAAYNSVNNSWNNLTSKLGPASNNLVSASLYLDGLVYTGFSSTSNKILGAYNISSDTWTDLSPSVTIGSTQISSITYDNIHNVLYCAINTGARIAYTYNPLLSGDAAWSIIFYGTGTNPPGTTTITYDNSTNTIFTGGLSRPIGAYYNDLVKQVNTNYTGIIDGMIALDYNHNTLYTAGSTGSLNALTWTSPCVETWVQDTTTCNSSIKLKSISFTDTHQCGTTYTLPANNGTTEYCCIENWRFNNTACNGTNYIRQYSDFYSCGTYTNVPADNGTVLSCTIRNESYIYGQLNGSASNYITGAGTASIPFYSFTYDYNQNMIYSGGLTQVLGRYNISNDAAGWTNLTSTLLTGTSRVYGIEYDPTYKRVYTGAGVATATNLGYWNITTNNWIDLSATDTKLLGNQTSNNWASTNIVYNIKRSNNTGLIYTAMQSGRFGVYNSTQNIWYNINPLFSPASPFASSSNIQAMDIDNTRNLIYAAGSNGKLGVYNISGTGTNYGGGQLGSWKDLSSTDPDDWIGTNIITNIAYDSKNNLLYIVLTTSSGGKFGVYNPVTNTTTDITYTATAELSPLLISGTPQNVLYDSTRDLIFTAGRYAQGVYDPVTAVWSQNRVMGNWVTATSYYAMTMADTIYLGSASTFVNTASAFGKLYNVSCVENWLPADTVCSSGYYTRGYYDSNTCGTTQFVPSDNGTIGLCNYNYVLDTWYEMSDTARYPEYRWSATTTLYPIGRYNGSIYLMDGTNKLAKYDPITDITSYIIMPITMNFPRTGRVESNGLIYTPGPIFGVYNISSNTWTDLSGTDVNNTLGIATGNTIMVGDLLYTFNGNGLKTQNYQLVGVYNATSNVWTDVSPYTYAPLGYTFQVSMGTTFLNSDGINIYYILATSGSPTFNYITKYNIANKTYSYSGVPVTNFSTGAYGGLSSMIQSEDTLYIMQNPNPANKTLTKYNITSDTVMEVSTPGFAPTGGGGGVLSLDPIHQQVYTYLSTPTTQFGVYDIASNIWYNHSIQGNTSIGDELPTNQVNGYFDSTSDILFVGDIAGFHLYKTPYGNGTCLEHWVQDSYTCYGMYNYTKTYHDTNFCGTNITLPVDNGTIVSCPILYPNVTTFNGVTPNFTGLSIAQLMNYSGLILENTAYGRIEWDNPVNVYGANFDANIRLLLRKAQVNTAALNYTINTTANITVYNTNITTPGIYRDGIICTTCNLLSNNGSDIKFSVVGFSNYTVATTVGNNFTIILNTTALGQAINETQVSTDATGRIVWAVGQTNKIYVSTTYGQTWTNVSNPLINNGRSLYTHPDNSFWLMGSGSITYTGIYRSTNNGTSWTQVETTGTYNSIDCNNYGVCLAGRGSNPAPGGVYRSTDYGQTWTAILNITGITTSTIFISDTNESIFGQLSSGTPNSTIYYSNNTINYVKTVLPCVNYILGICADSWRGLACNNNNISECYMTLSSSTTPAVSTGIYKSISKGYNWTLIQNTPDITDYRYGSASLDLGVYAASSANGTLITHYMDTPFTVNQGTPMRGSAVSSNGHLAYAASTVGDVYRSTDVCIENWVQEAYDCYNNFNYTIIYNDTNNCGTTITLPANNGTIGYCNISYPIVSNFDGITSNFTGYTLAGLENFSGLILENTSNGKIEWNNVTNVSAQNFDAYITIAHNYINVNSGALNPSINSPTNISLYNLSIISPWVYKDGIYCPSCSILSNNGSTIKFYAPSFSNYTIGNCSEVWVQQPPMTCTGLNSNYTIRYTDSNSCGTTYSLPANNGTLITCVLITYSSGTTPSYTSSNSGRVNVSTNANYTIIKIYNATGGEIASNLLTSTINNFTNSSAGLFDALHPSELGIDGNYSTYSQPNATGYATTYINQTIPYMATRLSQWNLVTYSNTGPGIDVNVTIPDDCWLYPKLQLAVEMYNDVGIHYVYPQCYNGTAWNILTIDQNSNHSGLYETSMIWILANGTDYTNTNMTDGTFYYNATGYPQSGQPVSAATQNFTIITRFHNESYTANFPYPNNGFSKSSTLTYGVNTTDPHYNYSTYIIQGLNGIDTGACYQENANDPVDCGGTIGSYSCILSNGSNCDPSLAHDSNWGTYFAPLNGTYIYVNWSYNAGLSVNNATWYYKDNSPVINYSTLIPPTCIMNPIQLRIQFIMLGSPTFNYWGNLTCKNSTGSWINFYTAPNGPYNGTIKGLILYEDAMQWQFSGAIIGNSSYSRTLPDGKYYYAMTVYDKAGNNQFYDPNVTIDTTPPTITYLTGTQADNSYIGFNKTNFTVNISVNDTYLNMTTIWLYKLAVVDSYALYNTTLMNKTFTGLTNGVYQFNVTATDEATNIGTAPTRTVTLIDTFQEGLYTVTYNYPNDYVSNVSTNNLINFTTTDPYYAYALYNVSGTITNTTLKGFTPTLTEGIYTYSVRIYDLAGNSKLYPTQNITIDGTNPVINYIGITPANNSYIGNNQTNITVNIQVIDMHVNTSTNQINLYDSGYNLLSQVNGTNITTFIGLTQGVYYFNASSQDTFGHIGTSGTRKITIVPFFNASAYNVLFNYNSTDIITSATFNATSFTTTDPYYSTVNYGIQLLPSGYSGSESTTRQFKNWTVPVDGIYHNYLTIYDLAGNSQYYDQNITVSAGIPTLSYAADTDADLSYKNQPYIFVHILPNATNATNMTTIIYLYNSTMGIISTANNTNTSNFTGLSDGVYHFNAIASNLGYNTTALTRTVTIHTSFSSGLYNVTFPTADNALTITGNFTAVNFTTTDPYYAYAIYNLSGGLTNTTSKNFAYTGLGDGTYTYSVRIYDLAGNNQFYGPRTIRVDVSPPYMAYNLITPLNGSVINTQFGGGVGYVYVGASVNDFSYNRTVFRIFDGTYHSGPIHVDTSYAFPNPFTLLQPLPDGYYEFDAVGYDNAGWTTTLPRRWVTLHMYFNTSAYNVTFPYPNNKYLNSSNLTYGFTTIDPYYSYATYDVTGLNIAYNATNTTGNKSHSFILPDGKYYYAVTIYDMAGNSQFYDPNITIDTTPPTVIFTNASDGSYVYMRPYLYLQTEANDTNLNYTIIRVYNSTGGLLANYTGNASITTFTTSNYTDAFYYVNATAYDLAGNPGYSATYQIEIDYIKNAVQFYASEKVTDNHLYYNITFNSSTSNFQESSPGMSKSKTVNGIPWNIYNVTISETVNGSYYTCNYYNWNATNNYIFPNCALYNSLDYINLTHSYLGTAINNYNVTIINTANAFIEIDTNVSNYSIGLIKGLNYTIYFDQAAFFSNSINYNPVNTSETINTNLNNTNITLRFKSAFGGNVLNGTLITINDTSVAGKIFNTSTGYIVFNPNSGTKNFTMQASGDVIPQPFVLTLVDRQTGMIDVLLYPILNVSLYDERMSLLNQTYFNFNRTTESRYTLYCYYPQNYTISGVIPPGTTGPLFIPTPCIFDRIRFDLVYTNIDASTFTYYRTITFPPTTTNFAFKVFLIDHTTTDSVGTALKPYDIFGIYTVDQNTQIQIKEIFPSGTELITSDFMDSEGKVTVTLMTAGQYIITVLADDAPIRTLGPYYADSAGTKILRLFDVTLTGPADEQTAIIAESSILENDSIQMYFKDSTATTKLLSLNTYDCGCDDPAIVNKTPIMTGTYTQAQLAISGYTVIMTTNVNGTHYMNKTSNKLFCTTYNRTDTSNRVQTTGVTITWDFIKRLPAQFKNPWSLPWIIMLLFVIIALGATTRTAAPVSLLLALMASLLYTWEWFIAPNGGIPGVLPSATLGFAIILALFFNFKRVA